MNSLFEILNPHFVLRNALISSLLIGAAVPPVGVFLVVGRRTILALTLPQVSTLGVALVVWLGSFLGVHFTAPEASAAFTFWAVVGSLGAMAAALSWQALLERKLNALGDAESGAIYALATALTLALAASRRIPELGLLDKLKGEVLAVPDALLTCQAAGFAVAMALLIVLARPLQFLLFDRTLCYSSGLPADFLGAVMTCLIGAAIALGGLCAGPFTVFAFLILPPLAFLPFVRSVTRLYVSSSVIGVLCAFIGFWISYSWEDWNLPISAAQIILLGLVWIIARTFKLARVSLGR
jgi:ABC-type Mn2+/Zn2+ transport system permease subunit